MKVPTTVGKVPLGTSWILEKVPAVEAEMINVAEMLPALMCTCGDWSHVCSLIGLSLPPPPQAGEALQRDGGGGEGLRQRQQAAGQRDPGPVPALPEGPGDLGEAPPPPTIQVAPSCLRLKNLCVCRSSWTNVEKVSRKSATFTR